MFQIGNAYHACHLTLNLKGGAGEISLMPRHFLLTSDNLRMLALWANKSANTQIFW